MKSDADRSMKIPESAVLAWAIRTDGQGSNEIRTLLHTKVDWKNLREMAQSHQIGPFLYHQLKSLSDPGLEKTIDIFFKDLFQENIIRNFFHSEQLLRILYALSEKGINTVPFKGIVLAAQVFGTTDLRQCGDIDLLIGKNDLFLAKCILQHLGYASQHPPNLISGVFRNVMRSETFTSEDLWEIDLHWNVSDILSWNVPRTICFPRMVPVNLSGSEIRTFAKEDHLILLSAHGMKHFWPNLKTIVDIIWLLHRNPDIDLISAITKAEKVGLRRSLYISLHLSRLLGGVKYSQSVNQFLKSDRISYKIALYIARILNDEEDPDPLSRILTMMRSREDWLDSAKFGIYAIFSYKPPGLFRIRLPLPFRPLYLLMGPYFRSTHN